MGRMVTPLIGQAVRYAGKTGLETGIGLLSDVLSGENMKTAAKRRASAAMFLLDKENKEKFFDSYGLPPPLYTPRFTKFRASHPGNTERNVGTFKFHRVLLLLYVLCFTEVAARILKPLSNVWTTLKPTIVVLCSL